MLTKVELLKYIKEAKGVQKYLHGNHPRWQWAFAAGLTALPSMLAKIAAEESRDWVLGDPEEHLDRLLADSRKWIGQYLERYNAFIEAVRHYADIDLVNGSDFPRHPKIDSLSKLSRIVEKHTCEQHVR